MVTVKCKCGKSGASFKHLTEDDFEGPILLDCCVEPTSKPKDATKGKKGKSTREKRDS